MAVFHEFASGMRKLWPPVVTLFGHRKRIAPASPTLHPSLSQYVPRSSYKHETDASYIAFQQTLAEITSKLTCTNPSLCIGTTFYSVVLTPWSASSTPAMNTITKGLYRTTRRS